MYTLCYIIISRYGNRIICGGAARGAGDFCGGFVVIAEIETVLKWGSKVSICMKSIEVGVLAGR